MSDAPPGLPPEVEFWRPPTLVATWFGIGLLPLAPGTWASISTLPMAWYLHAAFGAWAVALAALVVFAIGWWASENFAKRGHASDPSYIVVDEVAGQLVALAPAALDPVFYAIALIGFRVFDIMKPWPVVCITALAISNDRWLIRCRISRQVPRRASTPACCQDGMACSAAVSSTGRSHLG